MKQLISYEGNNITTGSITYGDVTADLQSTVLWAAKIAGGNEDIHPGKNMMTKLNFESRSGRDIPILILHRLFQEPCLCHYFLLSKVGKIIITSEN